MAQDVGNSIPTQTTLKHNTEYVSVLKAAVQLLLKARDRRRIRKAAAVLSKNDMYEAYFVGLLSSTDKALLQNLLREV